MDGEVHFRSLGETNFPSSSEHHELTTTQLNSIDRLYAVNHQALHLNPLQSFGLTLTNHPSQPTHFDILTNSIPGHHPNSTLDYDLQVPSSLPLPPPQSPQYPPPLYPTNLGSLPTPLRLSQVPSFFTPVEDPGAGKLKCRFCARVYCSTTTTSLAKHITSVHNIPTELSSSRPGKRGARSSSSPAEARRNFVSNFFKPITTGPEKGKRKCAECNMVYSQSTSSSILSRHLAKIHRIDPKLGPDGGTGHYPANKAEVSSEALSDCSLLKDRLPARNPPQSLVWSHFSATETLDKEGNRVTVKSCHHCTKTYSTNTSNSGLARHLFSAHSIRLPTFVAPTVEEKAVTPSERQPISDDTLFKSIETSMEGFPHDIDTIFPHVGLELSPPVTQGTPGVTNGSPDLIPTLSLPDLHHHFLTTDDPDGLPIKTKHCRYCDKKFGPKATPSQLEHHLKSSHFTKLIPSCLEPNPLSPLSNKSGANLFPEDSPKLIPEECDYRFLQAVIGRWVMTNPEPEDLTGSQLFQELLGCLDSRYQHLSLEECQLHASSLEGIRNDGLPELDVNPTWNYFLVHQGDGTHQCIYCHFVFSRTSSSGVLVRHLLQAHPSHFPEGVKPSRRGMGSPSTITSLQSLVTKFLIFNLRPVNLFKQELFQKYLTLTGHSDLSLSPKSIHGMITRMYREQAPRMESLLRSSLSSITILIDFFRIRDGKSCLVVTFSFVDQSWQPRRTTATANWYSEGVDKVSFDGIIGTIFYSFFRCISLQLRVAGFVVNIQERGVEFKELLERRLQSEYSSTVPVVMCLSNLVDSILWHALSDHPVVIQLRGIISAEKGKLSSHLVGYDQIFTGRDWRSLEEVVVNPTRVCNLIPRIADHISNGEWDELGFFLNQLRQVQRTASALYESPHPTLSEAFVTLKGLTDQLLNITSSIPSSSVPSPQPQILHLVEMMTGRQSTISETLMFLATFLDPRFKQRIFGESVNYNSTLLRIKKHLTNCPIDTGPNQCAAAFTQPRSSLATVAASFFSPRSQFPDPTIPQCLEEEIESYLRLPLIEPQVNPFLWWSAHQMEFPNLHHIALEHLSVPAAGHILLPSQCKFVPLSSMGAEMVPMLALWTHHRYHPASL